MNSGSLTVAAVDIGVDTDIPRRTINGLLSNDIIVCESIHVIKLIAHLYDIDLDNKKVIEFNENISRPYRVVDNLIESCRNGKDIILVANQGTPLIKDPGQEIVTRFRKEGFTINCVPGPSAIIAALSISGIAVDNFYFAGWIPARYVDRSEQLQKLKNNFSCTIVMFEAIFSNSYQSMIDINEIFGDETIISILIDISKNSEQVFYGYAKDALPWIDRIINSDSLSETNPDFRYMTYVIDNNFRQ